MPIRDRPLSRGDGPRVRRYPRCRVDAVRGAFRCGRHGRAAVRLSRLRHLRRHSAPERRPPPSPAGLPRRAAGCACVGRCGLASCGVVGQLLLRRPCHRRGGRRRHGGGGHLSGRGHGRCGRVSDDAAYRGPGAGRQAHRAWAARRRGRTAGSCSAPGRRGGSARLVGRHHGARRRGGLPVDHGTDVPQRDVRPRDPGYCAEPAGHLRHKAALPAAAGDGDRGQRRPTSAVRAAGEKAGGDTELLELGCGHFDIYTGAMFEQSVSAQVDFLTRRLSG